MGQVLDKFHGRDWRKRQIRKISDKVFEHIKNQSGRNKLTFEDLYIAVLLVYNDINKRLPGPHFDPPSKDQIRSMMQGLLVTLVVAPTVAVAAKRATEDVPGVGKVVRKVPTSIYASLVTLAIVWFQTSRQEIE
ncbi:F-box/kelch-repeat protein SKIP25-like [Hibiscus syriacus]|uniref:F-box/kelch-repeat protein SKIP25-like n=1 Tax=Hibiscus syriacus TaxID=106335 RepID=A0A6A2Y4K8_HIBSY|nr:F-box/kelch-repeat protein SKIP25-like [Hibiscus syriacus]